MNLQQIEYALAVSEVRHFGQAAKRCHVTQSTLSTMVGRLEEELGILIFDRRTKPIGVTPEGAVLIKQLRIISKEVDRLHEMVEDQKGMSGQLRIGVIPTVAPYLMPLFLNAFIQRFPKIHFEVDELTTEKIIDLLAQRTLDVGIVSLPLEQAEIREIPLYNEPFVVYDRSQGTQPAERVEDIDQNRLWLLAEGHCMRGQVESICNLWENRTVNDNLNYKSGTISTLVRFVNRHAGVTLLPMLATLDFSTADQIFLHQLQRPTPVRTVGLAVHAHYAREPLLEALRLEIEQHVQPLLTQLEGQQEIVPPKW